MKGYLNPYSDGINTSQRTGPTIENLPLEQVVGDNKSEFEKLFANQERQTSEVLLWVSNI